MATFLGRLIREEKGRREREGKEGETRGKRGKVRGARGKKGQWERGRQTARGTTEGLRERRNKGKKELMMTHT
jgi:hypothetical protein